MEVNVDVEIVAGLGAKGRSEVEDVFVDGAFELLKGRDEALRRLLCVLQGAKRKITSVI